MNPGALNKRIEVWEFKQQQNELLETVKVEQFKCKLWANIIDVAGFEKTNDVVVDVEYRFKVKIRYNKTINDKMIIKYQGRVFEIKYIVDVNLLHKEMILLCKEVS